MLKESEHFSIGVEDEVLKSQPENDTMVSSALIRRKGLSTYVGEVRKDRQKTVLCLSHIV